MKKAMSPLLSTIILIGFAIALGGIVMSWGRAGYVEESQVGECGQTSLSLVDYGENRGICTEGGKLYFTMQNDGEIELDGIKVSLLSIRDMHSTVVEERMVPADVVRSELEYPDIGKIEKVIFTPRFTYLEKEKLCPKNGFSVEDVGEC